MIQELKPAVALPVLDAKPTLPGDGAELGGGTFRRSKYAVAATLAGGTSLELVIYVLVNGVWGRASDAGISVSTDNGIKTAILGGGALLSDDVYHFTIQELGIATRIALVKGTNTGGVVATATLALVREKTT